MPERKEIWKTVDGRIFDTWEEAHLWEAEDPLLDRMLMWLDRAACNGEDLATIAKRMLEDGTLARLWHAYYIAKLATIMNEETPDAPTEEIIDELPGDLSAALFASSGNG